MRKGVVVIMAVVCAALIGAAYYSYDKAKKSEAAYTQARAEQESMRQRYDQAVAEIVAVQDSLNTIVLKENQVQGDIELQGQTVHDKVLARIATLKTSIAHTKARIEELDAKLKHSGIRIAGLKKMINGLRETANYREQRIAELQGQVGTLQTKVTGLTFEIQGQQEVLAKNQEELAAKQQELATIYYTMGTKKELANRGVVQAQGGVLGVGKTIKVSGMFEEAAFSKLNTDQENVIRIPSKKGKVQILSAQPPGSYSITKVDKDMAELRILDRNEFRKVKHLVILKA